MKTYTSSLKLVCLLIASSTRLSAQELNVKADSSHFKDDLIFCISASEYLQINQEIEKNLLLLNLNPVHRAARATVNFEWPLRPSSQLNDCSYYYISAFVDLNPAGTAIQDWNCGSRTYDGHRGIDIVSWPFIWDKMDHDLVEVVAAAAGTIIAKVDGNPDRVCNGVGGGSNSNNYLAIQHEDGSHTLYVHLKTGMMTNKLVGQTVVAGEYLGIPGSAGQSTGQHLHFEVRSLGTFESFIEPHFGACNSGIGASRWINQKPYTEPQLVKLSTHSAWPYFGICPNTHDTTSYQDTFVAKPGAQGNFQVFTKHVQANDAWSFKILNPDLSVFDSWTFTSLSNRLTSNLGWNKTLPSKPGTYTFEGSFKQTSCSKSFTVISNVGLNQTFSENPIKIYPNPNTGQFQLEWEKGFPEVFYFLLYDLSGQVLLSQECRSPSVPMDLDLAAGLYFYRIVSKEGTLLKPGTISVE